MVDIDVINVFKYMSLVKDTEPEDLARIHGRVFEEVELPPRGPKGSDVNITRINIFMAKVVELLSEHHDVRG